MDNELRVAAEQTTTVPWWFGRSWVVEGIHRYHRTVTEDVWQGRILDYCKDCDLYFEVDNDPTSIGYQGG